MMRALLAATSTAAFALAGCASPLCGSVSGPAIPSPGPQLPQFSTDWHRDALGEKPRWIQANRPTRHMLIGFHCGGGTSGYFPRLNDFAWDWAQLDTFDGERPSDKASEEPVVCVFHPFPNTVPTHELRNPRRLPSGALEGDLWEDDKKQSNGAAFLLEGSVIVVARGSAVPRVRAMVSKSATPPPPLPIANDVHQWTYANHYGWRSLSWLYYNGASIELRPHATESEARSALEEDIRTHRIVLDVLHKKDDGRRAWLHGTDLYIYKPDR